MNKHTMRTAAVVTSLAMLAACSSADTTTAGDVQVADVAEDGVAASPPADAQTVAASAAGNAVPHDVEPFGYDEADIEAISLGATITSASDVVSVDGTTATITAAGVYELTGTLTDGQVVVDAGDDDVVRLILNGVDITNADGAAIAIMNADTAIVILADGSSNSLTDGAVYRLPEGDDEPNATLFSKADLTLAGAGSLAVVGQSNDGIASKDGLVIEAGDVAIDAVDDGLRGKDYVVINDGDLSINAGGDGIKADNEDDLDRGFVSLAGGVIDITAGDDGIQAATDVLIAGGTLAIAAVDDGIHGDHFVTIDGGTITITESYEGIESEIITINDGSIDVISNDDGLNVTSSEDTTTASNDATAQPVPGGGRGGPGGGPGGGGPGGGENVGEYYIHINGGMTSITVTGALDEQGDGIDANGHVVMTGGVVTVSGPTDTRNSAIDYSGGSFEVAGGTLVGTNVNGRNSEGIEAGSEQAAIYLVLDAVNPAGTIVHIQSASGESLVTFEPANDYDVVVFTSPDLVAGESYEIYLGGSGSGETATGLYETYSAGTLTGTTTAS